ncbi:sulfate reduction electron transfer complex DsrMKJOP subunit DsrO [Thiohalomonas denitrificans]|uniref:Tetrathionate reductase subunit B n=1 Tax=Thiohalomonas denitrificans TaxID=415747 RepID=A0A1G5QMB8_9GAMM|nr:4Fe-4S dicluster domain-containing protein [Thiohalomonas denitrificans]SCZ62758.1 tetrathionate reductase subunit B [Thiohalomonas denitrificans]
MDTSRRNFFKGIAVGAAATAVAPSHAVTERPTGDSRQRWGMVIDLRRCIGCQACTVACGTENRTPLGSYRTVVSQYELSEGDRPRRAVLPRLCNHCEDPPCIPVCPVDATFQRADGIVLVDNTRCVGCGYCVQACPYDARFINAETGTADKCTFCAHRVDAGLLPACVETCVGGARVFGDLNDPDSAVSQLIAEHRVSRLNEQAGTEPQVRYIGLDGRLQNKVEGVPAPLRASLEEVMS